MPASTFAEKRTRSQLTIPDALLSQLSQGSPWKDARTALRQNGAHTEEEKHIDEEIVEETDDELLLSPGKAVRTMRTTKRSVSPPPGDEYAFRPQSPSEGRELKRKKLEEPGSMPNGEPLIKTMHALPSRSAHTRSLSQPNSGGSSAPKSSLPASGLEKQSSSTTDSDGTVPGKGRAQSVPIFPSSLPSGIVHIDLRNPPPSPRRPRSRSPSKEQELCIVSGTTATAKLATIPDEVGLEMHVDKYSEISNESVVHSPFAADTTLKASNAASSARAEEPMSLTSPLRRKPAPLVLPSIIEPQATPSGQKLELSPLSPLTPIPETPLLSKTVGRAQNRYVASGWATGIEEEQDQTSALPPPTTKPLPALAVTIKSRLPRPSSSSNMAISAVNPPAVSTQKTLASGSSKPVVAASKPSNAFTVLMANAREQKDAKGKGKEKAVAGSSSDPGLKLANASKPLPKRTTHSQGKAKELPAPKTSLKSKMKPKTTPKPKPKPAPVSVPSPPPEIQKDLTLPPSLYPAPPSPVDPMRPATSPVLDISMESIEPVVEAHSPMDITPDRLEEINQAMDPSVKILEPSAALTEPTPSTIAPRIRDVETSHKPMHNHVPNHAEGTLSSIDDTDRTETTMRDPATVATSSKPQTVDPPAAESRKTKIHISKRVSNYAPVSRVTRSASLKRNQKIEVPKALPLKPAAKETAAQKQSSVSEAKAIASDTLLDDTQLNIEVSNASLPNVASGSGAPNLPPGSPMKRSPAKKATKSPRNSFAQPTKSTTAKQVSPTKPMLPKSRSSSPNKLGRSVSMSTRPRASLSRSFTSYSNLDGSSLSTLSSALEKLQQRPPGRPNTSMGFNRDNPDSSIELETTSKDDSSISTSGPSTLKAESSSQATAGITRLVQRTLFGGPRSSLTGKSSIGPFGSGTVRRSSGGFKVPGKSRIFGVGGVGGAFSGASRARIVQKASRKTSLPSVMASPVKGGDDMDMIDDNDTELDGRDGMTAPSNLNTSTNQIMPLNDKGKGKERATESWNSDASRRVSLASQALSQSLIASSTRASTGLGLMGPPATPKGRKNARSASSTYPSTSSGGKAMGPESPTRSSLRIAHNASNSRSEGSKTTPGAVSGVVALKVLKDCVIFVDVRNDDGDEVGSLFVEMLEGVGARILTRVGQTCTHIVYKDGLMSTLNRYRLLRDPKPLVVGIAWVVECVEQMKRVDETKFLVDLDGINVSGTNKRRRSMLPKLISREFEERNSSDVEGDVSMDGSTSSMAMDDDLTPLEKARRRKAAAR